MITDESWQHTTLREIESHRWSCCDRDVMSYTHIVTLNELWNFSLNHSIMRHHKHKTLYYIILHLIWDHSAIWWQHVTLHKSKYITDEKTLNATRHCKRSVWQKLTKAWQDLTAITWRYVTSREIAWLRVYDIYTKHVATQKTYFHNTSHTGRY